MDPKKIKKRSTKIKPMPNKEPWRKEKQTNLRAHKEKQSNARDLKLRQSKTRHHKPKTHRARKSKQT